MSKMFIVSDGLSKGTTWATYRQTATGALHRVKSPYLPLRATREEAERDLAVWLYNRAPRKREDRARRAGQLMAQASTALSHARRTRNPLHQRQLIDDAYELFVRAWHELELGIAEPAHPDRPMPFVGIDSLGHALHRSEADIATMRVYYPAAQAVGGMRLTTQQVLDMVAAERQRQERKWGVQDHGPDTWISILAEEVGECAKACLQALEKGAPSPQMVVEATHVAAVAVAMIENMATWYDGEPAELMALPGQREASDE